MSLILLARRPLLFMAKSPINWGIASGPLYSVISKRTIFFSSPKNASANAFEISVFPTPVGPIKRKEERGRLGLPTPERDLLMAPAMLLTASSWPTILLCKSSSRCSIFSASFSFITPVVMPVFSETKIETSFSLSREIFLSTAQGAISINISRALPGISP